MWMGLIYHRTLLASKRALWRDSTYSETSYAFDMHSHALAPSNFNNCFIFMNIVTIDVLIPPKKPLRTNSMFTT